MAIDQTFTEPIEGFIPPLSLEDPIQSSNATSPQVLSIPVFDSQLARGFFGEITPDRIRELRNDPTIAFLRETITSPAIHTPWNYIETKNAPAGAKDFIEEQMEKHRIFLLQESFYGCVDFGWQGWEKVMTVDAKGFNVVSWYKQLLQEYTGILIFLDTGRFAGLNNSPTVTTRTGKDVALPLQNSMIVNFEVEGTNWYGKSVFQVLNDIQKKWNTVDTAASRFDQKVAGSHWVLYYPVGQTRYKGVMTTNDKIAERVLATLQASGTTAIPDEVQEWSDVDDIDDKIKGKWRLELLSDKGNSQQHFTDREKYLDNLKARAFGLPERSVFEGKFGTKAEAEVHADIGISNIDMKHRIIAKYLNLGVVRQLMTMNYGPEAADSVMIQVTPLVDSQYNMLKDIYHMILQSPGSQLAEMVNIDTKALRQKLDITSVPDAKPFAENLEEQQEEAIEAAQAIKAPAQATGDPTTEEEE